MTQREFNKRFKELNSHLKNELILRSGIRKKYVNILILWYIDELSYNAISERLGLEYSTIGNLLVEAKKCLKSALIDRYGELPTNVRRIVDPLVK